MSFGRLKQRNFSFFRMNRRIDFRLPERCFPFKAFLKFLAGYE